MSLPVWNRFKTRAPGKWVLAGEHAVLRGATALAVPHPEFALELEFEPESLDTGVRWQRPGGDGLRVEPESARSVIEDLLQMVRDEQNQEGREFPLPRGQLRLNSSVPTGAGLGSSAALCVAMARWLAEPLGIPEAGILEFATHLEHRFHGRSSGMDVAVCAVEKPVSFVRGRGPTLLRLSRFPRFTFHDTGLRASTSDCIRRVEKQWQDEPAVALKADEGMARASRLIMEGLMRFDAEGGSPVQTSASRAAAEQVGEGMNLAHESFLIWGLVPGVVQQQIAELRRQGALGAKLTGAGGGGFIVAVWE